MEARDYMESGQLELYVYGLLTPDENLEINRLARHDKALADEIYAIEEAIIALSSGFAPELSPEQFQKLREQLIAKHSAQSDVISLPADDAQERKSRSVWGTIGWAAAVLFLAGAGYLFYQLDQTNKATLVLEENNAKKDNQIKSLEDARRQTDLTLQLMRDPKNQIVDLQAQPIAPQASARIYWNKESQAVTIDASSLPKPPEGQVYQAWAIYNRPFNAVSIGVLENGSSENLYVLHTTSSADAFGVTLEPAGGSETPTLEQLYVMGAVTKS